MFQFQLILGHFPRRKRLIPSWSNEYLTRLRNRSPATRDIEKCDYELEGLDGFLNCDQNFERSLLLWNLLLKSIEPFDGWKANSFFKGYYEWQYYSEHRKTIDASFLTKLQKAPWLVNTDGKMVRPSEITLSELAGKYPKEIPNMDVLKEVLGFRPDVFDQLPKDCQKILKLTQGYSPDEIKEALARGQKGETSKKKEEDENSWKPKCEPKDLKVKSEIVEPEPIHSPELEGQTQSSKNDMVKPKIFPNGKEEETKSEPKFSTRIKKDIGQWGEECVLNHFKQEYRNLGSITDTERGFRLRDGNIETEVVWLNANSEIGKGYDFAVLKDNVETEYIEVKTKLGAEKELINITGTQWEFARKLFDQNQGEKYWIYSVVNAGQSNAKIFKIQNPIKLWKDGRLYAHPIQFKL